ncbi:cupin domain-containing protein [Leucothrix pacifica]|uniref:Cupin domain-containing protein n=1 Tax=Leucothrix pacifica TaxID=1247513 RepID=A0A317CAH4_9GAMM|nr:cupin domain-containing protein [Leucothrix pacifica]PWQ95131.1 cupin domain-containing protein [Leucothrix pacifica]
MKRLPLVKTLFSISCVSAFLMAHLAVAHDPIEWNGDKIHVVLDKDGTDKAFGMFTVEMDSPKGPPRHIHEDADEAFYVLKGEAEVLVDGEKTTIKAGEAGFAPKGKEHTFKFTGDEGGKILVVVTPGGFEGFFGASVDLKIPDQMPELEKISKDHGQVFTGPPLGKE